MTARKGVVRGLPEHEYHAGWELNSTGIKALLDAPARFQHYRTHSRPDKRAFDMGHLIHELILGVGQGIHVADFDSWRTKAAQEADAAARRAHRVPVLRSQLLAASHARREVRRHPVAGPLLFGEGESEVSLFWTEDDIACRGRIDRVTKWIDGGSRDVLIDVKSASDGGANPWRIGKASHDHGQHIQAAFYLDGAVATGLVDPDAVFLHVHVETAAPHLVTVSQLTQDALEVGREQYRRALDIFRQCSLTDTWPGYAEGVVSVDLPAYAYREAIA